MSKTRTTLQELAMYLAFGAALVATLGSLYYSQIAGFVPCTLCWYQRIAMYPLVVITLVGILRNDDGLLGYVLPLSLTGLALSTYHYLIQVGIVAHSGVCAIGVPCNARYVNYLGFVTIPLMALTAFFIITVSMVVSYWAAPREGEEEIFGQEET